jgi:hypothetical protein
VSYARRWALGRNPLFYNFADIGGDCTNFVSQCVLAGSCVMNTTPDFGWYYRSASDRAPAWAGVEFFWRFMTEDPMFVAENGGIGPFGRAVAPGEVAAGDVIQLQNGAGEYYHTLLVSGFGEEGVLVAAHTVDALDRPLSSYNYAAARFLHIDGVRLSVERGDCYPGLLAGERLPRV